MFRKSIYARRVANKHFISIIIVIVVILICYQLVRIFFGINAIYVLFGMIIILVTEEIVNLVLRKRIFEYKKYSKGARGEELISRYLDELGDGYIVVNDIKFPWIKSNIDHVVIGTNGIFLIETKNYKGKIMCNDDEWDLQIESNDGRLIKNYIIGSPSRQARGLTYELKAFLKQEFPKLYGIWINAIVVFVNNKHNLVKEKEPRDCKIFDDPKDLIKFIKTNKLKSEINITDKELRYLGDSLKKYSFR